MTQNPVWLVCKAQSPPAPCAPIAESHFGQPGKTYFPRRPHVEFIDGARAAPPCLSARGDTVYQRRTARERALVSEKCRVSAICATLRRESCRSAYARSDRTESTMASNLVPAAVNRRWRLRFDILRSRPASAPAWRRGRRLARTTPHV